MRINSVHAIIIFDEMQNGAIWGHFRVSYNIESSTILMTDIQEYLKIVCQWGWQLIFRMYNNDIRPTWVEPVHRYGTRRAKKGHMNLWRAPLTFDFFIIIFFIFSTQIHNLREVSVCPRAPKQYCSALQNFSWRPWYKVLTNHYVLQWPSWFAIWQLLSWNPLMTNQFQPGMPRILKRHNH